MKGKHGKHHEGALKGRTSRDEVMKEAHSTEDGFNKGGAVKKKGKKKDHKVHGEKAHERGDKKMRRSKHAAGGKIESEAGKEKRRPGFGEEMADRDDD